jgi:hypothetical protein
LLRYASPSESRLGIIVTTITTTKRGLRIAAVAAVLTGAAAVQPAGAQEPAATVVDVSECVKLTAPEDRLACFEKSVETARTTPAAPPAAASNSRGGFEQQERREEPAPPDIQAKVTELRETVPNAYLITLDNGQVWRQTVPKYYPLQQGQAVRIYYSRWRSYRLTTEPQNSFIQVERAR